MSPNLELHIWNWQDFMGGMVGRKEIWTHFWAGACCQDNNIHSPVYYTTVQTDQQQIYCRWRRRPENVSNSMRCRPLNHKNNQGKLLNYIL